MLNKNQHLTSLIFLRVSEQISKTTLQNLLEYRPRREEITAKGTEYEIGGLKIKAHMTVMVMCPHTFVHRVYLLNDILNN